MVGVEIDKVLGVLTHAVAAGQGDRHEPDAFADAAGPAKLLTERFVGTNPTEERIPDVNYRSG